MSLLGRLLWLVPLAVVMLVPAGCKSGGGMWAPGFGKWGSSGSASDLAVSRPTTKIPKPSGEATPQSASSLANRSGPGTQNGPYGSGNSSYTSQPAGYQGEPHGSVAPAGGYQTGGQYNMASTPGVTPGAYAAGAADAGGSNVDSRVADQRSQSYPITPESATPYAGENAADPAQTDVAAASATGGYDGAASTYQDSAAGGYIAPDAPAQQASDVPSGADVPVAAADSSLYGDAGSLYGSPEGANPAATQPAETEPAAAQSELPSTRPPTSPMQSTTPTPTTSPATSSAPFAPPTLPSSLSTTGGYRPGSTASPGTRSAGVQQTIYEQPATATGTGYSTTSGTMLR